VVYLLLAWLTAHLALGDREGSVSKDGAFHQLSDQPLGQVVLWLAVAGFGALVVWEACEVLVGHRDQEGVERWLGRASSAVRIGVFAALGVTAAKVALGSSGGSSTKGMTAKVMALPLGQVIVGLVGLAVLGYGLVSVYTAVTDRWRHDLDADGRTGDTGRLLAALARTGYLGRGVAFGTMGSFLVWAALTHDPKQSAGLDQSLVRLREASLASLPVGPMLLGVVAVGLACYGAFNIAKVRHLRHG
jgi:hypothetical protein